MSVITRIWRRIALLLRPGEPGPDAADTGIRKSTTTLPYECGPTLPGAYTPRQELEGRLYVDKKE